MTPPGTIAVIDVGGTDVKSGLIDRDGELTGVHTTATPLGPQVVDELLEHATAHVAATRDAHPDLVALGLIAPGIIDDENGVAVLASNLGWRDVPMRALLAERVGLPVAFGHDVATAGLAEVREGAAAGAEDAAVIVIGTGIAAALFSNGRPIRGGGYAGELGHAPIDPEGPRCACGGTGCLEAIASAAAIARRYSERSGHQVPGAREVLLAAGAGDGHAAAVWHEAMVALARSIAQLAATLAPEVVVLGGGLSRAGHQLLDPVQTELDRLLSVQRRPQLRLGQLGTDAGLIGAGILAQEALP
ncbi:MAG TPA: ROK family protein [Beutenbergiaceae bacterium]|nr:ROK family protein [Beutenbergiaceae bacterium]